MVSRMVRYACKTVHSLSFGCSFQVSPLSPQSPMSGMQGQVLVAGGVVVRDDYSNFRAPPPEQTKGKARGGSHSSGRPDAKQDTSDPGKLASCHTDVCSVHGVFVRHSASTAPSSSGSIWPSMGPQNLFQMSFGFGRASRSASTGSDTSASNAKSGSSATSATSGTPGPQPVALTTSGNAGGKSRRKRKSKGKGKDKKA